MPWVLLNAVISAGAYLLAGWQGVVLSVGVVVCATVGARLVSGSEPGE